MRRQKWDEVSVSEGDILGVQRSHLLPLCTSIFLSGAVLTRINVEVWVRRPRDERCLRLWHTLAHQRKAELCMPRTDWQLDGWLALSSSEHTELKWDPPGEEPHALLLEVAAVSLDLVWSKSCLTILPIYMQHSSLIHQVLYWFNLLLPYFRSY